MLKVGVTGGIGSGKTTVCNIFQSIGIPVYNADKNAKHLMTFDPQLKADIKNLLGKEAYHRNGRLNRPYIASIVFKDSDQLKKLNQLVHPAVRRDGNKWFEKQEGTPYAIKEAALLIESKSHKELDVLIVVSAPEDVIIKRVMKRDQMTETQIRDRMKNQLAPNHKEKLADYIIHNDDRESLIHQVWKIHQKIVAKI